MLLREIVTRRMVLCGLLFIALMLTVACQPSEPIILTGEGDNYHISLELDAPTMGFRNAQIYINDKENNSSEDVKEVFFIAEMTAMPMNMPKVETTMIREGFFEVREAELFNMTGEWYITVSVDGEFQEDIELQTFNVTP